MTSEIEIAVLAVVLGFLAYFGYRKDYYGQRTYHGILIVLMLVLIALFTSHIHLAY